eukprot:979016-Ditylum_brightwellii.AAC.1
MAVQVFPNRAYKLQKQYIWHMMHKPRHIPVHKWISRVVKFNNYLMEFPKPPGAEARKLEQEELQVVLENEFPPPGNVKWIKKALTLASAHSIIFTKTCIHYKECKPKATEKTSPACKSHSKRGRKHKAKCKASKKAYPDWGQDSQWHHSDDRGRQYCKYHEYCAHTTDEFRITINQHKASICHEREDRSHKSKEAYFSSGKAKPCESLSDGNKDLLLIINEKIAVALSH